VSDETGPIGRVLLCLLIVALTGMFCMLLRANLP
jgi:hypothetical protein